MTLQFYSYIQVNKWSKNFHDKPHCRGIFHWENLMPHSTVSAASHANRNAGWQHAGNLDVIPLKSAPSRVDIWTSI